MIDITTKATCGFVKERESERERERERERDREGRS